MARRTTTRLRPKAARPSKQPRPPRERKRGAPYGASPYFPCRGCGAFTESPRAKSAWCAGCSPRRRRCKLCEKEWAALPGRADCPNCAGLPSGHHGERRRRPRPGEPEAGPEHLARIALYTERARLRLPLFAPPGEEAARASP